ncbi:hypothetical protein GWK74_02085 [Candidatus Saccharibacteria bacterium oral taxon 488]|jgi:hypothetical protein|nr:hypothetical protein GWK74_02085 [Candidatus Saccharibacteria bacterium oral taxon 488]QJU04999.1 hypothetical protein FBF32_01965 [Candidatus Saccharibacteria bacterium oral taxon 488]QJU10072.1 hypothetical protein FBF26_02200 [Candidatus Saccharibacteria bacterium oral taxon 488]
MRERRYHSPIADGLSILSSPNFQRGVDEANHALAAKTEVTKRGERLPRDRDPENIIKQHITPHFPDDYIGSLVTITNVTESDKLAVCQLRGELLLPEAKRCMVNKCSRILAALAIRSQGDTHHFPLSQETISNILQFDVHLPTDLLAGYFSAQATNPEIHKTILNIENAAKYAGSPADRAAIIAWGVQTLTQQLGEDFCKGGSFSGEGSTFTSEGVRLPYSKFNDMRSTGFSVITDYTNDEPTPRVALSLEDSDGTIQVIPDRRFLSRLMRRNISDG